MYLAPYHVRDSRWIMVQHWHDLLFAHWPVPPETLRPLVPAERFVGKPGGHPGPQRRRR